uniref:Protein transport protein Sec24C n=1 Tax=Phallusia mammillata TaxID=59560 RepID=A0A6F9DSI9_9ASCI|nr:protein transport protein Sec24C [Phallusia mammillata]
MQQPPPPANQPMYNGAASVTYAHGGGLQTTKQMPPATSGSLPSRQPAVSTMNGYHQNALPNQGYQNQYQQQPPPISYNQQVSSAPSGPGSYQPGYQGHPQQKPNYGPSPPVAAGGGYRPPPSNVAPPPSISQAAQPMATSASPMQPPVQQMQNMSMNNQMTTQQNYYPPQPGQPPSGPQGLPPRPQGMPPGPQGMPPGPQGMPPGPQGMPPGPQGMPPGPQGMPQRPQGMAPPPSAGQPQPGYPNQPGPGMHPYPNQAAPAPAKRLDPDAMPSPIQVIEDDKTSRGGEVFRTEGRGLVPPLITTPFTVEDLGSASPRFVRCATYNLPGTADMAKNCQVPMSIHIKPMANLPEGEAPPLLVDHGQNGPIRCKRCKAYMCPQFNFIDGGRRFQCVMCNAITETPHDYFEHLDHMNMRQDKFRRPELCRASYEFIATKDYCRDDKFPPPPAFIFAIDVSYNAIKSGYVELLCRQLQSLLDTLPREEDQTQSSVKVGFFTYSNVLHFYNLNSSLAQPQMMVVSDVNDVFVPLQDGFLVNLHESRHVINSLLDQIPDMFRDTRETELVFAPVIQAAVQALKSARCAGKLFMFHTSLPIGDAPGKLKNRDDRKLIGTDKEKVLFSPASNFYEKLAKECVSQSCCVDLFLFPTQYVDIATLSQVPQLTGGQIYNYKFFRPEVDGERFIKDLAHDLQRDIVFDAIMRVRTSTGIRPVEFIGSLYMSNTTDVELAAIDCDKSITIELKHDDKINEEFGAYLQIALLYTSVGGHRKLRLHNLNLSVCTQLSDMYRSCETDVLMNTLVKKAVKAGLQTSGSKIREDLISQSTVALATYRKHCAAPSSPGQLILPECMKLVPVYLNCLLKNDAIHSSTDISTDDRAYLRQLILSMDVTETQVFLYPRLLPVLFRTPAHDGLPAAVRCSEERLKENEVYILENGISLFLWVGQAVDSVWIQNVFGVQSAGQIDIDLGSLMVFDNDDSRHVRNMVDIIQSQRTRQMKLTIIRQRDKLEPWFKHFLVEDRGAGTAASYVDFLCHMHKEIRTLLS